MGLGRLKVVSLADNDSAIQAEDDWTECEVATAPAVLASAAAYSSANLWMPMRATRHIKIKKYRAAFGLEEYPLLKAFDNINLFIISLFLSAAFIATDKHFSIKNRLGKR